MEATSPLRSGQETRRTAEFLMVSKAFLSGTFLSFVLRNPCLDHSFQESGWQRLVHREVNGALGCSEALEFVLEHLNDRRGGKQTAVVRERRKPHQCSLY